MTVTNIVLTCLAALSLALAGYNHWQLRKTEREWRENMKRRLAAGR